jgi:2'-5' RNA ligase
VPLWCSMCRVTQSVELVLDEELDALVRADWDALAAAGLPSQARHRSPSNRPHFTLAARAAIDESLEAAMALALGEFPVPLRLGALSVFGRDRFVLVRAVVPDIGLLQRQAALGDVLGDDAELPYMRAGHWVPHVTLAHRMTPEQVALALSLLHGPREADGYAVGARRWDGDARREWVLAGAG